jgi:hypothetical protein
MMAQSNERLEILEMIQQGKISSQEGLKLIEALGESWDVEDQEYLEAEEEMLFPPRYAESADPEPEVASQEMAKWRRWWVIPFWTGVGITVLGGALMYWAWSARGIGLGFIAAWIPFLIGLGIMVLGWNSRTGPWIHIRIKQAPGESPGRIALSFPLPTKFFAWSMRTFSQWIPDLPQGIDEVLLALGEFSPGDHPLSINVNDQDDGEQVKIYIG